MTESRSGPGSLQCKRKYSPTGRNPQATKNKCSPVRLIRGLVLQLHHVSKQVHRRIADGQKDERNDVVHTKQHGNERKHQTRRASIFQPAEAINSHPQVADVEFKFQQDDQMRERGHPREPRCQSGEAHGPNNVNLVVWLATRPILKLSGYR